MIKRKSIANVRVRDRGGIPGAFAGCHAELVEAGSSDKRRDKADSPAVERSGSGTPQTVNP